MVNRTCDDCGVPIVGHGDISEAHFCYDCGRARVAYQDALGFDVQASWEDIAAELGITRQRVQQIYEAILAKLKRRYGVELRAVLMEMQEQHCCEPAHHSSVSRYLRQEGQRT